MFTGIITDIGRVQDIKKTKDGRRVAIRTAYAEGALKEGASIACSGVCLTVVGSGVDVVMAEDGTDIHMHWFAADVSKETLERSTLGSWCGGDRVNLERGLKVGDALDGHLVSGHVDGVAVVEAIEPVGDAWECTFSVPKELQKFIAEKGSVALDGVSLTVNQVDGERFSVMVVPYTFTHTIFQYMQPKDVVNVEIDMLARYVARLLRVRD